MIDSSKKPINLDRSKLLGFDQAEPNGSTLPAAKVGPKDLAPARRAASVGAGSARKAA
ncbi:MAG: hypothetical protein WD715_03075 [Dongiaceae bacterium]